MSNYSSDNSHALIETTAPTKTLSPIDERTASLLAEIFRALSDPSRIRIVSVLAKGETSVGALAKAVSLSESAVSHHLRGLRQMRLVRPRKSGRQVYYTLDDEHIADLYRRGLDHVSHS
jgi:ArsR family transcriptional regulator, lead/cadmium/zinc/bismuth-responsive transcriptional repressor